MATDLPETLVCILNWIFSIRIIILDLVCFKTKKGAQIGDRQNQASLNVFV